MNHTSIYAHDGAYAREHGEVTQYRESLLTNIACKEAIEASIRKHFDGMHLNKEALADVLSDFTPERIRFVLAATLQQKDYDGRFSTSNHSWAAEIDTSFCVSPAYNLRPSFAVQSHPAVLDGFVSLFRREKERERKPAVNELLKPNGDKAHTIKPKAAVKHNTEWER
ncbi:MAG: DUF3849 domain-containing protein [Raoultibacter sp.]